MYDILHKDLTLIHDPPPPPELFRLLTTSLEQTMRLSYLARRGGKEGHAVQVPRVPQVSMSDVIYIYFASVAHIQGTGTGMYMHAI